MATARVAVAQLISSSSPGICRSSFFEELFEELSVGTENLPDGRCDLCSTTQAAHLVRPPALMHPFFNEMTACAPHYAALRFKQHDLSSHPVTCTDLHTIVAVGTSRAADTETAFSGCTRTEGTTLSCLQVLMCSTRTPHGHAKQLLSKLQTRIVM